MSTWETMWREILANAGRPSGDAQKAKFAIVDAIDKHRDRPFYFNERTLTIATIAGWMVCEVGRQPWVVTGLLSTGHAAGPVPAAVSALVLLGASIAATVLLSINVVLSLRWIHLGLPPSAAPAPAGLSHHGWPALALQAGPRGP